MSAATTLALAPWSAALSIANIIIALKGDARMPRKQHEPTPEEQRIAQLAPQPTPDPPLGGIPSGVGASAPDGIFSANGEQCPVCGAPLRSRFSTAQHHVQQPNPQNPKRPLELCGVVTCDGKCAYAHADNCMAADAIRPREQTR